MGYGPPPPLPPPSGGIACAIWLRAPLPPPRIRGVKQITNNRIPKGNTVADGNCLYFSEFPPSRTSIAQFSVAGGETASVNPGL